MRPLITRRFVTPRLITLRLITLPSITLRFGNRIAPLATTWALAFSLLAVAGCGLPLHKAQETISEVFETDDSPTIVVETFNGSIDISSGNENEVVVEVTRRASGFDQRAAEANLASIEVQLIKEGDEVRVKISRQGSLLGEAGASVVIAAPKQATIQLESSNAPIISDGMRGPIDAKTSNAKIGFYEATGTLRADTSNAPIVIENATDALVHAETSNASIGFSGTLTEGEHRFQTSNAKIELRLPQSSQFEIDASTSNAGIHTDFPIGNTRKNSPRHLKATIGDDPRFSLDLATSNGPINIRAKK